MPGENLRKQVWTGNQMHIWRQDWESNSGPLVHSAGEEPLRYLLPQLLKHGQVSCRWLRVMKQNRLPAHLKQFKQDFKLKCWQYTYPLSLLFLKGYYKIFWQETPSIFKKKIYFDMIIIHKYKIYPVKDSAERGRAYSFFSKYKVVFYSIWDPNKFWKNINK